MGTEQHQEVGRSLTRLPVPAPSPSRRDLASQLRLTDCLIAGMRPAAERAMLELDALLIEPPRYRSVRRRLTARRDAVIAGWREAFVDDGRVSPALAAHAVDHAKQVFRNRVRDLRAAAAPGGHA